MGKDEALFDQVLLDSIFDEKVSEVDLARLLADVKNKAEDGISNFENYRKLETLKFLCNAYVTACRTGRIAVGFKDAILCLMKGVFQSKSNYKKLLRGIKITSINKIPENAITLVYQADASFKFDEECMMLLESITQADIDMYVNPIGFYHQLNMANNRNKVNQLAKKYQKS